MAWLTSPAWVALFLRATGSLAAIFTQSTSEVSYFTDHCSAEIHYKQNESTWGYNRLLKSDTSVDDRR